MNNDENSNDPLSTAPKTPASTPINSDQDAWMSKAQYSSNTAEIEKIRTDEMKKSKSVRTFYILLAVAGLLLFILYIGMLISPSDYTSRGNCTQGAFLNIAFWLNPVAYIVLSTAGSFGIATRRLPQWPLGLLLIIVSPIAWFITGLSIISPILCGV